MTRLDQERKDFEAWVLEALNFRPRRGKDDYIEPMTNALWVGWMARAKQSIEESHDTDQR